MKVYFVYNTNMEPVPIKYISRKKLINKLGIQNREKHIDKTCLGQTPGRFERRIWAVCAVSCFMGNRKQVEIGYLF